MKGGMDSDKAEIRSVSLRSGAAFGYQDRRIVFQVYVRIIAF